MSALQRWWRELRDGGASEAEALREIAARLGETESETRRLLTTIARVKVEGSRGKRPAKPTARPAESVSNRNGQAPPGVPALDEDAVLRFYSTGRESGLSTENALRAASKRFRLRPHDVRAIVNAAALDIEGAA